ncbi:delta(24)-sterol reductase [Folsomia candida]|uniref:Delta(24)-sterol reductase n=1 Tax=Folsomia candida TaxID=158441 RepID=A0A226EQA2_FOLCA|nr:delta(24)-sterol reductase [Folsomia candida]OXA58776.1 Delta(24)-sterol reductase [Folsomia candida]
MPIQHPTRSILRSILDFVMLIVVLIFTGPFVKIFDYFSMSSRNCFTTHKRHAKKVANVQAQVRRWIQGGRKGQMCSARPGWKSFSIHKVDKRGFYQVEVDLNDIIEIDVVKKRLTIEPGMMMGQLTKILTDKGFTIPVVPELDTLTVGGLICGGGIETSSHHHGLFSDVVTSFELVTADGDVLNCSETENSDYFYAVPGSSGTVGFLTSATIPLIPAGKYMQIEYVHVDSIPNAVKLMQQRNKNHAYVEGIIYSMTDVMLMFGDMTSNPSDPSRINYINRWYKPFFHNIVENVMNNIKSSKNNAKYIEYFPLRDYFHRHSRGMFWQAENTLPALSNPLILLLFGWLHPLNTHAVWRLLPKFVIRFITGDQLLQDFCVPTVKLDEFLQKCDTIFKVYPIWLCPVKMQNKSMAKTPEIYGGDYMDLGFYGPPINSEHSISDRIRECEQYMLKNNGFLGIYAEIFLTKGELRQIHCTAAYDKVRNSSSSCRQGFPDVFDKITRRIK